MCGSTLQTKGGMSSVIRVLLDSTEWEEVDIRFLPTHIERNKAIVALYFLWSLLRILWTVCTYRPHIAHLHTAIKGSFIRKSILSILLQTLGIKVVLHHHGSSLLPFYQNLPKWGQCLFRHIVNNVDSNIVLSLTLQNEMKKFLPDAPFIVIPNAVNTTINNPYTGTGHLVTTMGRLGKRKGTYDLLQTIEQIDKMLPSHIQFALCGDGDVEEVKTMTVRLGITHRIAHIGWVSGKEREEILAQTLLHVLPSYHEAFPMAILETMARGIPNISTRIASIPEVVKPHITGYLITPEDIDSLGKYILQCCTTPTERLDMSKHSYELITKNYSQQQQIEHIKSLYRSLR